MEENINSMYSILKSIDKDTERNLKMLASISMPIKIDTERKLKLLASISKSIKKDTERNLKMLEPMIKTIEDTKRKLNMLTFYSLPKIPYQDYFSHQTKLLKGQFIFIEKRLSEITRINTISRPYIQHRYRELLLKHGWLYIHEIPQELFDKVLQCNLNGNTIDEIIVDYFRANDCEKIKELVSNWYDLKFFKCREIIFTESIDNHIRGNFNSSVTMLTLHIEGVMSDFSRIVLNKCHFKFRETLNEMIDTFKNDPAFEVVDLHNVFSHLLRIIKENFEERFDYKNPMGSNNSRNMIGHGHSYKKETETNSIKLFLYLNELYRLFIFLDQGKIV